MAAPKELKSAASAGKPQNVKAPVPSIDEDLAAMEALSEADLADLSAMEALDIGEQKKKIDLSLTKSFPSEFGSMAEAQAAAQAFVPSRETVADVGASLVTQVPARLGAAALATPIGPVAQFAAQSAAGAGVAALEKDVANLFRRALGAPENEDRSRATDVAMSLLFDIPGAAIGGGKFLAGTLDISKDLALTNKKIMQSLSPELQNSFSVMKSNIQKAMSEGLTEEQAAKQVANLEDDFTGLLRLGYSPKEAGTRVAQKYSFQIRAKQAADDLLNSIGPEFTQEEFAGKVVARPQNILDLKMDRVSNQIGTAFEAVKQTKGLDQIDSSAFLNNLQISLNEARGIGDEPLAKNLETIIDALGERQKLKTQYNDLAKFSEETGGKPPRFIDIQTGKSDPAIGAALDFAKESKQFLTQEEYAARLLPPKVADQNENFVMQSIQDLIAKRMRLDKRISTMPQGPRRDAMLNAVGSLRYVEDEFMTNLSKKGGEIGKIADNYITAKQSYHSLKDAIETMGGLANQDAVGVAQMIDSGYTIDQLKAWSRTMPQEVKDKVGRRYMEGVLNLSAGLPDRPYTQEQFKRIEKSLSDKSTLAKLQNLLGSERTANLSSDVKQLGNLVNAASRLPEGAGPERAIVRKLFSQAEAISKKYGLNFIYGGRMALGPETRVYREFLNYMMSKDFSAAVKSINSPAEVAVASAELSRVFGRESPIVQRFTNYIQSSGLLPYAGPNVGMSSVRAFDRQQPGQQ